MSQENRPVLVVWSEEDAAFLARVLDLPGCMADGSTPQEALENAHAVAEEWVKTAKELGRKIPRAMSDADFKAAAKKQEEENQKRFLAAVEMAATQAVDSAMETLLPKLAEMAAAAHREKLLSPQFEYRRMSLSSRGRLFAKV
jgi:predicted RNase H-like HicB family nuclease